MSRRVGLRFMQSIGGKVPCLPCGNLKNCGFEKGDFTGWTLSDAITSIVTTPTKCGKYSMRINDSTLYGNHCAEQIVPVTPTMYFRNFFYVDAVTINTARKLIISMIYQSGLAGIPYLSLSIGVVDGVYKLYGNYINSVTYFPSNSVYLQDLALDTWIKALLVLGVGDDGWAKLYLDDVLKLDVTGIDTNDFGNPDSVLVGDMGGMPQGPVVGSIDIFFDETYEDSVEG